MEVSGDSYLIHTKPYPTLNTSMELMWKETFIPLSQLAVFVEIVFGKYIGMTSKVVRLRCKCVNRQGVYE